MMRSKFTILMTILSEPCLRMKALNVPLIHNDYILPFLHVHVILLLLLLLLFAISNFEFFICHIILCHINNIN